MIVNVFKEKESQEIIVNGAKESADIIASTYGPNGKNVLIYDNIKQISYATKDGVSVSNFVKFNDLREVGAGIIRDAANKTNEDAGDGTTTTSILTSLLLSACINDPSLRKDIDYVKDVIKNIINENTLALDDKLKDVLMVTTNKDVEITENTLKAFSISNDSNVEVVITETKNYDTTVNIGHGFKFDSGYLGKTYGNQDDYSFKIDYNKDKKNVLVICRDSKVTFNKDIINIFKKYSGDEIDSIVIIGQEFDAHIRSVFEGNKAQFGNNFNVCFVTAPYYGLNQARYLETMHYLYHTEEINKTTSICLFDSCNIKKDICSILLKQTNPNHQVVAYNRDLLNKVDKSHNDYRIYKSLCALGTGNISEIKVGGKSDLDIKEKMDRYDDAVCAAKISIEHGIVRGGGLIFGLIQAGLLSLQQDDITANNCKLIDIIINCINEIVTKLNINDNNPNIYDPALVTTCVFKNSLDVIDIFLNTNYLLVVDSSKG